MSLSGKTALVIGAGGLGGPALLTLAAAGVGTLVLVEDDAVETSNLNRQPLFKEGDVGQRKATAAAARLRALFPSVAVDARDLRFDAGNALALVEAADVVVDGSDNFATKFLANDAALRARRPLVHGGILRTTAQLLTVSPAGIGGCLRCLFEAPPPPGSVPSCAEAGVLGATAGFAGALMGAEALRLLA
ncbi:HesA/MoeB/ThiF family protein, partial [Anaeromyxobacter sp. SG66]